ncbi:hypothetical protein, partial [Salmonella enterica]|uniref:hypothetical protein n=1 Tax=Salmonella enterica TaxID=28901 RepID=UPI001B2FE7B7|nr:hypothetical protein [Salmonella enterica subsp. enterica serovar Typhimurium]
MEGEYTSTPTDLTAKRVKHRVGPRIIEAVEAQTKTMEARLCSLRASIVVAFDLVNFEQTKPLERLTSGRERVAMDAVVAQPHLTLER